MPSTLPGQRGLAALSLVLVLLLAMSLALLWTGRSLVFEHRAAANQHRQALAFAAAESGLGWGQARLNDPRPVDSRCLAAVAGASFRDRYAAPWVTAATLARTLDIPSAAPSRAAASGYAPPPGLQARCRLGAQAIVCHCAELPGAGIEDDGVAGPAFAVELAGVAGEAQALWLTARGCSGAWADCASGAPTPSEAQAVVRVKLRLVDAAAAPRRIRVASDTADRVRAGPLAAAPGSWRDGHCSVDAPNAACGFAP